MKYRLPQSTLKPQTSKLISKEISAQKIFTFLANKKHLKRLAHISQAITKQGLPENLVRKKLPDNLGYGIFLHPEAPPILKGEIIASYAGEVLCVPQNVPDDSLYAFEPISNIMLSKEEQGFWDQKRKFHPRRLYCMHVDATKMGNFTRFINHSEKPNLIAEFFKIPANRFGLAASPMEILYLAKKKILPGEQLLVSYEGDGESSYWGSLGIKPLAITPKTFRLNGSLQVVGALV